MISNVSLPSLAVRILLSVFVATGALRADDKVLMVGNSLTRSVPRFLTMIAEAEGKPLTIDTIVRSATALDSHASKPENIAKLGAADWNWVVLQDLSTQPTKLGNPEAFEQAVTKFYEETRKAAPKATVILYQTWPFGDGADLYGDGEDKYKDPAAMEADLYRGYTELAAQLESKEPGTQVLVAPVGAAFLEVMRKYPEIVLHSKEDLKHTGPNGHFIAALTIYCTMTNESPELPGPIKGLKVKPEDISKIQQVVTEALAKAKATAAELAKK